MHRVLCGQRDSPLEREVDLAVLRDEAKPARKDGGIAIRRTRVTNRVSTAGVTHRLLHWLLKVEGNFLTY